MKILVTVIFFLIHFDSLSQDLTAFPIIISRSTNLADFVPSGWTTLSKIRHDFNKDSLADYAFILQSKDSILDSVSDNYFNSRMLVVVFQKADKSFEKSVQTNKLFGIGNWGVQSSDPFDKMSVDKDRLKISFLTGGTTRAYLTYFFLFRDNDWILSRYDSELYEWWDTHLYVTRYYFLNGVQEDLLINKKKVLKKKTSTIDDDLKINDLEKRIYFMTEIDASNFINPYKGDSAF